MKPAERITEPTPLPTRSGRGKKLIAAIVAVAVVVAGVLAWRATRSTPPPRYETARVDRGRIVAQVTATGTLSAIVTVQVGSQVSGRIAQLFVDFNCPVKKGQLIAKIDPELFRASLDQARANHAAASGDLAQAKVKALDAARQLERTRSLAEQQLVAQAGPRHRPGQPRRRVGRRPGGGGARRAGRRLAPSGAGEPRLHRHRLAHRRHRHLPQRRRGPDRRRLAPGADPVRHRRGPEEDAGRHQRRRGRRRQAPRRHGGDLHRRRVPGPEVPGPGPADPQRAADGAERRHLRRGHRRRQPGPRAQARA